MCCVVSLTVVAPPPHPGWGESTQLSPHHSPQTSGSQIRGLILLVGDVPWPVWPRWSRVALVMVRGLGWKLGC